MEERRDVRKERLHEAVSYLESRWQELFRTYYINEMTRPERAKVLGITASDVHKRGQKLMEQLKEIIFKNFAGRLIFAGNPLPVN